MPVASHSCAFGAALSRKPSAIGLPAIVLTIPCLSDEGAIDGLN